MCIALIALSGLLSSGRAFAQIQSVFTFGPKVALNYNNLAIDDRRLNEKAFVGLAGGLFMRFNLKKIYLQPEGYFTTKGGDFTVNSSGNTTQGSGRIRLSTFDVPLLVGIKLVNIKVFNIRAMVGPVASFVLNENRNDLSLLNSRSYSYNKSNIGFQAGMGFDVGNITFDARYEGGLNQINSTFHQRPSIFHFGLGFKIL